MGNDNQITGTNVTIGESYFDMDRAERRAFLRRLLGGMSPNPEVRAEVAQELDDTSPAGDGD